MVQNAEKTWYISQYYYDKGKTASEAFNEICVVYGPNADSISSAQRWLM